jgi:photosystem II stability/assembly factor-like uncharacterized protein
MTSPWWTRPPEFLYSIEALGVGPGGDHAGVWLVDEAHGWAVGDGARIMVTQDGGSHAGTPTRDPRAVCFVDWACGWLAGRDGTLVQTAWVSGTGKDIVSMSFATDVRARTGQRRTSP